MAVMIATTLAAVETIPSISPVTDWFLRDLKDRR
jgi:hypothetical protein